MNVHSAGQVPDAGARHEGAARPRPAGCPLLRPAHVPRGRGGDRAGRRHVPGPHHGLQEEVLGHEVLARLPPARGHGEQPRVAGGAHVQTSAAPSVPQPVFTITEKAPTMAFSWLKAPTSAFIFKSLSRHYT